MLIKHLVNWQLIIFYTSSSSYNIGVEKKDSFTCKYCDGPHTKNEFLLKKCDVKVKSSMWPINRQLNFSGLMAVITVDECEGPFMA